MNGQQKPCEVCGASARCIGFSAFVCKACTVFYRRTYKQLSTLKCRRASQCSISHELRNTCRKCRLIRCRQVGLRMAGKNLVVQYNGYPKDDIDEEMEDQRADANVTSSLQSPTESLEDSGPPSAPPAVSEPSTSTALPAQSMWDLPDVSSSTMASFLKYTHLNQVVLSFRHFEQRQRFLSAMHQDKELLGNETAPLSKYLHSIMENATLRLACIFIADILSNCDLNVEQRMAILKAAPVQVSMAHKIGLTARVFPDQGDPRVCMFVGLTYDMENLRLFLREQHDLKIDLVRPMFLAGHNAAERARRLRPSFIECVMLMVIVVFEEMERQGIFTESAAALRMHLYAEFNDHLTQTCGSAQMAAYRLIRLTSLMYEVKTLTVTQEDLYSLMDIFVPEYRNTFWQIRPDVPQSKLENLAFATNDFISKMSEFGFTT